MLGGRRYWTIAVIIGRSDYLNRHLVDSVVAVPQPVPLGALRLCSACKVGGTGAQGNNARLMDSGDQFPHCRL